MLLLIWLAGFMLTIGFGTQDVTDPLNFCFQFIGWPYVLGCDLLKWLKPKRG